MPLQYIKGVSVKMLKCLVPGQINQSIRNQGRAHLVILAVPMMGHGKGGCAGHLLVQESPSILIICRFPETGQNGYDALPPDTPGSLPSRLIKTF